MWDVGANNGVWNSNSRYLIQSRGFTAFLYEPDPTSFMSLLDLYGKGSPQVHLHNMAVSDFAGTAQFRKFPTGLENTITNHNHNQFDNPDYQCVCLSVACFFCLSIPFGMYSRFFFFGMSRSTPSRLWLRLVTAYVRAGWMCQGMWWQFQTAV